MHSERVARGGLAGRGGRRFWGRAAGAGWRFGRKKMANLADGACREGSELAVRF